MTTERMIKITKDILIGMDFRESGIERFTLVFPEGYEGPQDRDFTLKLVLGETCQDIGWMTHNGLVAPLNLENVDLTGATLVGADLRWACLRGANLQGADLQGANLRRADLREANLKRAVLLWAVPWGSKYDVYTVFPEGFDPAEEGMVFVSSES